MARLNSDGSVDRSFRTRRGFRGGTVYDALPLPDGRYLVAGSFSNYRDRFTGHVQNIITLNNDGSPDSILVNSPLREKPDTLPKLNLSFDAPIRKMHRQSDGKVILTGFFRRVFRKTYGGLSADGLRDSVYIDTLHLNYIARLNEDLTLDTTYNFDDRLPTGKPTVNGDIFASYLNSADQLMIAGSFTTFNGTSAARIARLDTLGALDATFSVGSGPDKDVLSIDQLLDGRIVASGYFLNVAGSVRKKIAMFTATGGLDNSFDPGESAVGNVLHTRVLDNGKILVSGFFDLFQSYKRDGIAILEPDGKLSTSFNNFGGFKNGFVLSSASITARSSIVLVGAFTNFDLKPVSGIVKLNY
ncbi:delta-60 repeat domain-containing protein [Niabella ginsengisoli]|uniref:Delta-60 repeat domain-containing protein n=2 Tax=Niabella ginsengisoli TaxID=522298 RepID=A0ABS9SIV5_9BACT|nr:delta-60 repeat domain-containing protein [Niabella ginsengisoli]MCH5598271.1 delta-60 repeat domain-containing protein [Niabella ginsengisoli]